jgi:caffeoyl-CoA O-methyltransferase
VHAGHDGALARAFDAPERHGMPAIQLGPSEARLVELLVRLAGARKAVEIGTLAGYSAIRLARALQEGGHLWTVEFDPKHAAVARENLAAAGLAERVTVVEGAGLDVLPSLEVHAPFDAVFVDADKASYDAYGRWAARHLRPGGLLIGDNAFLFGRLLEDSAEAAAMRRFHEEAARAFDTVCVPTPDGLLVGVKR